jgi:ATP-dependent Zn protease
MYEEEAGLFVISREELAHRPDAVRLINRILSEQLANARRIVRKNRNAVVTLVETVMNNEKKYLTRKDMEEVWEKSV